jgi:hypothetical protein
MESEAADIARPAAKLRTPIRTHKARLGSRLGRATPPSNAIAADCQAGVDCAALAPWLSHESIKSTQVYLHAHLVLKEAALAKVKSFNGRKGGRHKPSDRLLAFLDGYRPAFRRRSSSHSRETDSTASRSLWVAAVIATRSSMLIS